MRKLLVNPILLWALLVAFLGWNVFRSRPHTLIDPATRAELASLRATRISDSVRIDSLKRSAVALEGASDRAVARAQAVERGAAVEHSRAASLARSAARADSVAKSVSMNENPDSSGVRWRLAYEASAAEADSLRRANLIRQDSVEAKQRAALFDLHVALDSSEARKARLEVVNNSLGKAVEKAERGCRILLWSCPTRMQAAIGGSVVGLATGLYLTNR